MICLNTLLSIQCSIQFNVVGLG